jgi:hypothetical protein
VPRNYKRAESGELRSTKEYRGVQRSLVQSEFFMRGCEKKSPIVVQFLLESEPLKRRLEEKTVVVQSE